MLKFHFWKKPKTKQDIEPQEVFLDQLAKRKEAEFGISEKRFEIPLSQKKIKALFLFFILIFLVLFGKVFQLQILENKKFSSLAEQNKFIFHSIKAERGIIYDSQGEQMVFNQASFDLVLNKNKLSEKEFEKNKILKDVSKIINWETFQLEKKINEESREEIVILKNLDYQTLILLETRISEFSGFEIKKTSIRQYKDGPIFAHLLGYLGKINSEEIKKEPELYSITDYIGREGVEKTYEEILRKKPGETRSERDVYGNILSKELISLPESGKNLVLWLDSKLQEKIEQELIKALERTGAKSAVGVALNPKTGGVLALVSLPTFDNNLFNKSANQQALLELLNNLGKPLFNRAISGLYPTGSTIKPLIAFAALEETIISPEKKIDCHGLIIIPNKYDPEKETKKNDWTIHGPTDMRKAIAESCNVYFYTIGGGYGNQEGLGPSRIKKYLELFGWGNKTKIDLPAEAIGLIPSPVWKKENKKESWWDGDTYNLSIGQGDIQVSPIQVAAAFVAVANNGTLYQPKVVKQIVDEKKNLIEEIKPQILRETFAKAENLQIVREGMRRAVTGEGAPQASSILLNSLPVEAAAKTGTAELGGNYYHNWVTVFAPYDEPEIVLTIMIENIKDVQVAALPVAKEVLQWYFTK